MGDKKQFWSKKLKAKDHFEDLGMDVRRVLKWIFKVQGRSRWIGLMCITLGISAGSCEHNTFGFMKYNRYFD